MQYRAFQIEHVALRLVPPIGELLVVFNAGVVFALLFVVPLAVFAYCYGRIIRVLRRRTDQVAPEPQQSQKVSSRTNFRVSLFTHMTPERCWWV